MALPLSPLHALHSCFMQESSLLRRIYQSSASLHRRVLIGPGDDMALVQLRRGRLLAAVDQVVDGLHVRLQTTPIEMVGRKAMSRSLSDIAAMAAWPVASLATAVLPPGMGEGPAMKLFDAMAEAAAEFDCPLCGGDIAIHRDPAAPLVCTTTVLAETVHESSGRVVTRSGAQVGDVVYVTGRLGGSLEPSGLGRHLTFTPRIKEAVELLQKLGDRLHAMIDISDGLGRDASHIAERSGVRIRLNAHSIPANRGCDWRRALSDGEDYELCFTATGEVPVEIAGMPITAVGEVLAREPQQKDAVEVRCGDEILAGAELGWQHAATAP